MNEFDAVKLDGNVLNIFIFGDISEWWGYNETILFKQLRGKDVTHVNYYINSNGGSATKGLVIHDMIKAHKASSTAYILGTCYSAATHIACACDKVVSTKSCSYLIHYTSAYDGGTKEDLRKTADTMETFDNIIAEIYAEKTDMSVEDILEIMALDVVMNASDAQRLGFVDEIADSIDIDFFNIPEEMPASENEYMRFLYNHRPNTETNQENKPRIPLFIVNKYSKTSSMKITDLIPDFLKNNNLRIVGPDGKETDLTKIDALKNNADVITPETLAEHLAKITLPETLVNSVVEAAKPTFETIMTNNSQTVGNIIKTKFDAVSTEIANLKAAQSGSGSAGNGESGAASKVGAIITNGQTDYIAENQLKYLKNLVAQGSLSHADYKAQTGKEYTA